MMQEFRKLACKWPTTILSGGQTGVDQGGLLAAKFLGIATDGYAPRDYKTEAGYMPSLKNFGLKEMRSSSYPERTEMNVKLCDSALIIATDPDSTGTKLTVKLLSYRCMPYTMVFPQDDREFFRRQVRDWITDLCDPGALLIAGNRESISPGIQAWTTRFIIDVFLDNAAGYR